MNSIVFVYQFDSSHTVSDINQYKQWSLANIFIWFVYYLFLSFMNAMSFYSHIWLYELDIFVVLSANVTLLVINLTFLLVYISIWHILIQTYLLLLDLLIQYLHTSYINMSFYRHVNAFRYQFDISAALQVNLTRTYLLKFDFFLFYVFPSLVWYFIHNLIINLTFTLFYLTLSVINLTFLSLSIWHVVICHLVYISILTFQFYIFIIHWLTCHYLTHSLFYL